MKKNKTIITIFTIIIMAFLLGFLYNIVLDNIYDSRNYNPILLKEINDYEKKVFEEIGKNKTKRYTLYTHALTVMKDKLTGAYLNKKAAKDYSINNLNNLRRLKNVVYVYEEDFQANEIAVKNDYLLVKILDDKNLTLRAYFRYDPTIKKFSDFWYNGKVLTSQKSLHTFDALTGEGISTGKVLMPVLIEEEIKDKK